MFENCSWITFDTKRDCVTFRKEFSFKKEISTIKVNITAMGWYHLYINSKRIDKDIFGPGWTQYNKRVQYQTYKIGSKNKKDFKLECELAPGWGGYNRFAYFPASDNSIYFQKSIIYQIDIKFVDGSKQTICSGEPIDVYSNEIVNATIYDGEEHNPLYNEELLGKSHKISINTHIIKQEGDHIVEGERFPARRIFKDKNGDTIVDFGQNFSGYVEINIKGKKGDVISFVNGEVIDPDGCFYNENYREAKGFYKYTLLDGKHSYKPRFSFIGCRYIKLIDFPTYIKKENFIGVFVHSDIKRTNTFKCGYRLLNRLYKNQIYGQLSNYLDIPSDCPQRNERLGWTADAQVFAKTACINFDVDKFLSKYSHEMAVNQTENGYVPKFVPITKAEFEEDSSSKLTTIGWSDACIIIPYTLYRAYGNKKILKESYSMMNKFLNHYFGTFDKNFITTFQNNKSGPDFQNQQYGDWCATDRMIIGFPMGLTKLDLIALAYLAFDLQIMIETERALGLDSSKNEALLNKVKKSYQANFIKNGHMVGEKVHLYSNQERSCYTQTGLVMTLYLNLCRKDDTASLAKDLVELIEECGGRMTTGFLGTPWILESLSKNGYIKEAYDLLLSEKLPSWLYQVKRGATTIWEHYDCIKENGEMLPPTMNSFNHYAYGSFYAWVFNNTLGIKEIKPGYKEVLIAPKVDKRLGYAKGDFKTKYGIIKVYWKYNKNNNISYKIVVPKGIKAIIKLENGYESTIVDGGKIDL